MANVVNSYKDKYMGVDGRLSVMEILERVGTTEYKDGLIKEYEAVGIEEVIINGNRFKNYGQYRFIWEKSYDISPERSKGGSMGNINSIPTFLVAHLIMDFSVMSIDDYRKIMILHYGANEFTVECYDPIYNRKITVKMYFATEEMAKLYTIAQNRLLPNGQWEEWVDLVGVTEYAVELIGTNNDLDLVSVKYEYSIKDENGNPIYVAPNGSPMPDQYEEDIYLGEEIVVGSNSTFPNTPPSNSLKFKHWVDDGGLIYTNGSVVTVNAPLTLYAVWETSATKTLTFNYGLSDEDYTVTNGIREPISNREVQFGQSIGILPTLTVEPTETYNGEKIPVYENGAWYRTPSKTTEVTDNEVYWIDRDTTIYALYDKKKFWVTYHTGAPDITIPTQNVAYDEIVYTPTLYRDGYTFKGWYTDGEWENAFNDNDRMPPKNLDLYARWEVE